MFEGFTSNSFEAGNPKTLRALRALDSMIEFQLPESPFGAQAICRSCLTNLRNRFRTNASLLGRRLNI